MIDEKKLINYIKTEINPYGRPFEGTVFEFGCKVMEYIENMEKAGEWIPCSERLPEMGERVLLQDQYGCREIGEREIKGVQEGFSDGVWWSSANHYVAWMPLPAPYKEDMRGGKNE